MPTATLRFRLPEEAEEYKHANNSTCYVAILQEYDNYLRGRLKYEDLPEDIDTALQGARTKLHELAEQLGVSVW